MNAKDPTGEVKSSSSSGADKLPTPSRGAPESAPKPGQPDISKPQITLPPEVQQLLDTLKVPGTSPKLPQIHGQLPQNLQQVLDQLPPAVQQQILKLPIDQQEQALQKLLSGTGGGSGGGGGGGGGALPPLPGITGASAGGSDNSNQQLLNYLLGP